LLSFYRAHLPSKLNFWIRLPEIARDEYLTPSVKEYIRATSPIQVGECCYFPFSRTIGPLLNT
jgi:hypothetical protein